MCLCVCWCVPVGEMCVIFQIILITLAVMLALCLFASVYVSGVIYFNSSHCGRDLDQCCNWSTGLPASFVTGLVPPSMSLLLIMAGVA